MRRVRTFEHMLAKTVTGFALVATRLQTKKGFGLFCRSWPDLSRVRTFGVVREGFALLGVALPNIENGSHFCSDPGEYLERARTFGEGLQRVRTFGGKLAKGSHFRARPCSLFGRVRTFGHLFQRVRAFGARLRRVYTFCGTVDDLSALLQKVLRNQIHQIDVLRAALKGSLF